MRERILVQDVADINRVRTRVLTRWSLPHVEVSTGRFPTIAAQYAEDRFKHLADACNCLLGEILGGMTLLGGIFAAWVYTQRWRDVGLALAASLAVFLAGKTIEIAFTRLRLLWVLGRLKRRFGSSEDMRATKQVGEEWLDPGHRRSLAGTIEAAQQVAAPHSKPHPARQPLVVLSNAEDIKRLRLGLATRWRLPRIQINVPGLAMLETQRAQHRYVGLASGASHMLAGVLAGLALLGGSLYVIWSQTPNVSPIERPELWTRTMGWRDVQPVLIATLGAGLLGEAIEFVAIRIRLFGVLGRLRRQILSP